MNKDSIKVSDAEAINAAMKLMPDLTEQKFWCYVSSDDGGSHLVCAVERNESDKSDVSNHLPDNFMGWRSMILSVPNDYIDIFFSKKKED